MTTKQNEKLTPEVFEITTGLLLGDANLQKPKQCKYFQLRFAQNQKREDYVNWLLKKYKTGLINSASLKPLVACESPHIYQYTTQKNQKKELSFSFQTRISSAFEEHAKIFYANKSTKKSLCSDLSWFERCLTPQALAYWFMDDGTLTSKASCSFLLCTHAFKFEEVVFLSNLLNKKYENLNFRKKLGKLEDIV
uniref:Putative LAGLIDADG homing endonuclease n=1 Tax=Rhexinema sarcinoideum TaxID=43261 RepID=A0A1B2RYT0_9CHLO|nr:putative LAGLIDADG homing endonuclease [Rhexinema sarcinoideum]